jgi:hypothetical protein
MGFFSSFYFPFRPNLLCLVMMQRVCIHQIYSFYIYSVIRVARWLSFLLDDGTVFLSKVGLRLNHVMQELRHRWRDLIGDHNRSC